MPVSTEVLQAIGGNGLTAGDYAGLTPEQIQSVAGHGQQDRQLLFSVAQQMQDQALAERKQQFEEQHQDRVFKLMQRQDARADFESMHKTLMDKAQLGIQQQRLQLERAQVGASMANAEMERKVKQRQLAMLDAQDKTVSAMKNNYMEVEGYTDAEGNPLKLSIGELYSLGALDKAIETGLKRSAAKTLGGGSKQVELREYMAKQIQDLGGSETAIKMVKLMGPEGVKGMNKANIYAQHMKNNPLFSLPGTTPEEKQRIVDQDYNLVNMLKVDLASQLANETTGADTPGGQPPAVQSVDDIINEY